MYYSLKGKIVNKIDNIVVIDVHDISYEVLVSHPNDFNIGEDILIYTYFVIREDEQ